MSGRKQPLVQSVDDLTAAGFTVLTADEAARLAALEKVAEAAQAVREHESVCGFCVDEPCDEWATRDAALGSALAAVSSAGGSPT